MADATEAAVEAANGAKIDITGTSVGQGQAGDKVVALLKSENEYGEAISILADVAYGDTDDEVFGGKLAQKVLHLSCLVGFYFGNRIGARVAVMGGQPGMLGLALKAG